MALYEIESVDENYIPNIDFSNVIIPLSYLPTTLKVDWNVLYEDMKHMNKPVKSKAPKSLYKEVTINFFGYDRLGTKYKLTKTFVMNVHSKSYPYVSDYAIADEINKSLRNSEIIRWDADDDGPRDFGGPNWDCSVRVLDTVDY